MSELRESVIVRIPGGDLLGELFVGADGLPEIKITLPNHAPTPTQPFSQWGGPSCFRPATFPANWGFRPTDVTKEAGPLLTAWIMVEATLDLVVEAQREADAEERREPDCIDLAKAHLEAHGER